MPALRTLVSVALLISAVACLSDTTDPGPRDAQMRVVNASNTIVSILVDNTSTLQDVEQSNVAAFFLAPGSHHLNIQGSGVNLVVDLTATSQGVVTAFVFNAADGTVGVTAIDTGAIAPAGKSKVRVALLSQAMGAVDIYRIQPDFRTPTKIQTPFPYLTTSPFVQSDSGSWEVYATPVGGTTKLITTGAFNVESGGRRTVVFMDSLGKPVVRIMPE